MSRNVPLLIPSLPSFRLDLGRITHFSNLLRLQLRLQANDLPSAVIPFFGFIGVCTSLYVYLPPYRPIFLCTKHTYILILYATYAHH